MPAPRELTLVRTFDAPRDLVFRMWTDPKHFARWCTPRGFNVSDCELDARPGGKIRFHMAGLGYAHRVTGEYLELDPPHRLVFTNGATFDADGKEQVENRITVTFEEVNGFTQLTLHVLVTHATPAVEPALGGMSQGWSQCLDKLMEIVTREAA